MGSQARFWVIWDPLLEGRRHYCLMQNVLWMVFCRYIVSMWSSEVISVDLSCFRAPQELEKPSNSLYCRFKTKIDRITSKIGSGGPWARFFMNLQWFWEPWQSFSTSLGLRFWKFILRGFWRYPRAEAIRKMGGKMYIQGAPTTNQLRYKANKPTSSKLASSQARNHVEGYKLANVSSAAWWPTRGRRI